MWWQRKLLVGEGDAENTKEIGVALELGLQADGVTRVGVRQERE